MADSETLPHLHCPRCKAHDDAIIPEATLRLLASHDWGAADLAFHPRAMNQEQAVACELLTEAISRYWRAFGVECMGARLNSLLLLLRDVAKRLRISARIREARTDITARYREACYAGPTDAEYRDSRDPVWWEERPLPRLFVERLKAILDEPTPDYPGKDRDDAWLAGAR